MPFEIPKSLEPLSVRGVNYFPRDYVRVQNPPNHEGPLRGAWAAPAEVWEQDMEIARSLHVNTVRVFVSHHVIPIVEGREYDPIYIDRFRQFLSIAARNGIRAIVVISDHGDAINQTIIEPFKQDSRILMWDVANEPSSETNENGELVYYENGDLKPGHYGRIKGMLTRIKRSNTAWDPNHLTTVGNKGHYIESHIPKMRPQEIDLGDVLQYHQYQGSAPPSVDHMEDRMEFAHNGLPEFPWWVERRILIGEFGCPTQDHRFGFNEADQTTVYNNVLTACEHKRAFVAGAIAWCLRDFGEHVNASPGEHYFGLVRRDGTLKPAAYRLKSVFRNWSQTMPDKIAFKFSDVVKAHLFSGDELCTIGFVNYLDGASLLMDGVPREIATYIATQRVVNKEGRISVKVTNLRPHQSWFHCDFEGCDINF